jgi:phage-related holin
MDTISYIVTAFVIWLFSNWQAIVLIALGLYIFDAVRGKISFYEEKLLDIDDNVKQIAKKLGVND